MPGSIARFFMRVSNIVISVPLLSPNDTIGTALTVMQAKNVDIAPVADRLGGPAYEEHAHHRHALRRA